MPSDRAASTRPWPAIIMPASSTSTGIVQPHSRIDAAICATCARCACARCAHRASAARSANARCDPPATRRNCHRSSSENLPSPGVHVARGPLRMAGFAERPKVRPFEPEVRADSDLDDVVDLGRRRDVAGLQAEQAQRIACEKRGPQLSQFRRRGCGLARARSLARRAVQRVPPARTRNGAGERAVWWAWGWVMADFRPGRRALFRENRNFRRVKGRWCQAIFRKGPVFARYIATGGAP